MSTKKQSALAKVQNLYLMQVELWNFLDNYTDPDAIKNAQKTLREFKSLLKEVDWQYMGGEDVYESLQWIPKEVTQTMKKAKPKKNTATKKAVAKKTVKKPTAKKVKKKN